MKIVILGASGMVGQGAIREALVGAQVSEALSVGRASLGLAHPKLKELNFKNLNEADLSGVSSYDACLFALGASSARMSEEAYRALTYDLALSVANKLLPNNPRMSFVFISGAGSDAHSQTMWKRIKGETENALMGLNFKAVYSLRPALIEPLDGIRSKTPSYRAMYAALRPFFPLIHRLSKNTLTTRQLGRAMLNAAKFGYPKKVLEVADIKELAEM